ncbi:MAG: hypothetical protein ABIO44_06420 [Saprospiraceae bacterium]
MFILNCSEDFQLTEPYKDFSVVFGFLNRTDTAQYIRVEKLFVDEDIPATVLAQRVDSVYYKNAIVKLRNITRNTEFTLKKVDMLSEGYTRDLGPFAEMPNYMYKILTKDMNLMSGDSVEFQLIRGDNKPIVRARIQMVKDFNMRNPPKEIRELSFKPGFTQAFSWDKSPEAGIYDLDIRINLSEFDRSTNTTKAKIIIWKVLKDDFRNNISISNNDFYTILKNNLEEDVKYERKLQSIDLIVSAGGTDLKSFNLLVNANIGITASQEIPRYTNLSEGFGIFSSIHRLKNTYGVTAETLTSIDTSSLTRLLNIK